MKRLFVLAIVATVVVGILASSGCAQSAPPPAPTTAPAAPAKPADAPKPTAAPAQAPKATAAPAAQPTAAPAAAKVDFPEKGKSITVIVPFTAGGVADNSVRVLAPIMEKDLGTSIQIVNKPGASTMVGMTELVKAKPDGYTLLVGSLPSTCVTYLDPDMKAPYGRNDFQTISQFVLDTITVAVGPDTPYKTTKDFIDAAKAKPGQLKLSTTGLMAVTHLAGIAFEQATGTKFAFVHFPGGAEANAAVMGGHVDGQMNVVGNTGPHHSTGRMRVLAIMDKDPSPYIKDVTTLEAQGLPKVHAYAAYGLIGPKGMPQPVVAKLESAVKKAAATDEYKERIAKIMMLPQYLDSAEYSKFWDDIDKWAKPLVEIGKKG